MHDPLTCLQHVDGRLLLQIPQKHFEICASHVQIEGDLVVQLDVDEVVGVLVLDVVLDELDDGLLAKEGGGCKVVVALWKRIVFVVLHLK